MKTRLATVTGVGAAALLLSSAFAADVEVRVIDAARRVPLSNAAVCLGTPADGAQFGARRTGADGVVSFSGVPATPLQLTVSRDQYQGYRVQHGTKRFDVVLEVVLQTGGLGPVCDAPRELAADAASRLRISRFTVNSGRAVTRRRDVAVTADVRGAPTHFRISEDRQFADAVWHPFALPASFRLSGSRGTKTVYFQVRRYRDTGTSTMQSVSEVVQAQVALQ